MKATGIVRRMDDLGRVVIPKEVRRTMRMKEGDPLEIFVNPQDGTVCFRKYQPFEEMDWAKAKGIVSALCPNAKFGLYNDFGELQTSSTFGFNRSIDIDEDLDECAIITSQMDTIGYIIFDENICHEDLKKVIDVLKQFFSTNF